MKPHTRLIFLTVLIFFLVLLVALFVKATKPGVQASRSPEPSDERGAPDSANTLLRLDRVIELENGYIFIGTFHTVSQSNGIYIDPREVMDRFGADVFYASEHVGTLKITDAAGQEIASEPTQEIEFPETAMDIFPWALMVEGKQFAWPLTIRLHSAIGVLVEETRFEFDAGLNPQEMQQWNINKDVEATSYHVRLKSIQRIPGGYQFILNADPEVISVGVWFDGFQDQEVGGGGGGGPNGDQIVDIFYSNPLPAGKLTVVVSIQLVEVEGDWSITWQPDS